MNKSDEEFLQGSPNRAEVCAYVDNILAKKYIPMLEQSFRLGIMALQTVLLQKGICTGEEIAEATKAMVELYQKELEKENKE